MAAGLYAATYISAGRGWEPDLPVNVKASIIVINFLQGDIHKLSTTSLSSTSSWNCKSMGLFFPGLCSEIMTWRTGLFTKNLFALSLGRVLIYPNLTMLSLTQPQTPLLAIFVSLWLLLLHWSSRGDSFWQTLPTPLVRESLTGIRSLASSSPAQLLADQR